jgi:hypothetical protein
METCLTSVVITVDWAIKLTALAIVGWFVYVGASTLTSMVLT